MNQSTDEFPISISPFLNTYRTNIEHLRKNVLHIILQNRQRNHTSDLSEEFKAIHSRFTLRPKYIEDPEKIWDLVVINEVLRIFD